MLIKFLIVVVLIAILISLGAGFFFLIFNRGESKHMVNSLTVRVGLSVALFVLLFVAWYFDVLQPHPLTPPP